MRFSEKLPNLRKANNYSQEVLAEKLGVSRQAVSKWESGESYPDMERILELCKILNCSLEDILDDGAIGEGSKAGKGNKKFNPVAGFNDFLALITKTYNMFSAMRLKQKLKCLIEMIILALVLLGLGVVVFWLFSGVFVVLRHIPYLGWFIYGAVRWLIRVFIIITGFIIWFHIFKIRYLDYFITVEDQNSIEKTIEEPFDKPKGDRIIIRDRVHSGSRFLELLGKVLIVIFKVFIVFFALPIIIAMAIMALGIGMSLLYLKYGIIFAFALLTFFGGAVFLYTVLECLFKFIISKKQSTQRLFIMAISGIIGVGLGIGLGFADISTYGILENNTKTKVEIIEAEDNTILDEWLLDKIVIDNSLESIQMEIIYDEYAEVNVVRNGDETGFVRYLVYNNISLENGRKLILDILKNKKIPNFDEDTIKSIKITLSQKNYDNIVLNIEKRKEAYKWESYDSILQEGDVELEVVQIYTNFGIFKIKNNTEHVVVFNERFSIIDEAGNQPNASFHAARLLPGEASEFEVDLPGTEQGKYKIKGNIHNIILIKDFVKEQ